MPCNNCENIEPTRICEQTNVPQIDDTAIECTNCGFVSTNCIINPEVLTDLQLPENSDLTTIISTLVNTVTNLTNRILILEGSTP